MKNKIVLGAIIGGAVLGAAWVVRRVFGSGRTTTPVSSDVVNDEQVTLVDELTRCGRPKNIPEPHWDYLVSLASEYGSIPADNKYMTMALLRYCRDYIDNITPDIDDTHAAIIPMCDSIREFCARSPATMSLIGNVRAILTADSSTRDPALRTFSELRDYYAGGPIESHFIWIEPMLNDQTDLFAWLANADTLGGWVGSRNRFYVGGLHIASDIWDDYQTARETARLYSLYDLTEDEFQSIVREREYVKNNRPE